MSPLTEYFQTLAVLLLLFFWRRKDEILKRMTESTEGRELTIMSCALLMPKLMLLEATDKHLECVLQTPNILVRVSLP